MGQPMMKCGHVANARDSENNPVCAICYGIDEGAIEVAEGEVNLSERAARCFYYGQEIKRPGTFHGSECERCNRAFRDKGVQNCWCERPSSSNLPFFKRCPDQPYDEFYCGCHSWS